MVSETSSTVHFEFDPLPRHQQSFEIVERKGLGHPDTLADALGEYLSVIYSKHTLERFGAILHHNFDKVGLMGGHANVFFGGGWLEQPVRVLLNGRASSKFGDSVIPLKELLTEACLQFFVEHFPMLNPAKDLHVLFEVSTGSSPGAVTAIPAKKEGKRKYWFEPRSLNDLPEYQLLRCNDTSLGCAFAPYSDLEILVLEVEQLLNSAVYKADKPWLGSDIKIMARRFGNEVECTIALPQISTFVSDIDSYKEHLAVIRHDVLHYCQQLCPAFKIALTLNARDDYEAIELYLTYTGSSIESGDEGFVGRGNRFGGFIASCRPYTMEGVCGKNPVYHTGKLYCIAAHEIAWRIYRETAIGAAVYLIGQSGQPLLKPWQTIVRLSAPYDQAVLQQIVDETLQDMPLFTQKLLSGEYHLS